MNENHQLARYFGELKNGRMHGKGTFWFDTGSRYVGEFVDGAFHGKGTLYFKHGGKYEGEWSRGIEVSGEYHFNDGLHYEPKNWSYCTEDADRRFYPERVKGLRPVDRCLLSAESDYQTGQPNRYIPDQCYDTADGVYDPSTRVVYKYNNDEQESKREFMRNVTDEEHEWIVNYCRKGWDEFTDTHKTN